jgi:DNA-binding MarR family transcriptional regulator
MKSRVRIASHDLDMAYAYFNEINIIAQLSSNRIERELPHGLTLSQFAVLNWFVRVDREATPTRLARAFQVTKGAMTNTLGKLSAKGFIRQEPDPASGRQKRVRMTAKGKRAHTSAIARTHPALRETIAHFGIAPLVEQLALLRTMRIYLDEARNV